MRIDAAILAGGGRVEPLTEQEGVTNKAFIPINGKPLVEYIIRCFLECPAIERVAVVGPVEELQSLQKKGLRFDIVPEKGDMLENAAAVLENLDKDRLCLLSTGDIPLLTAKTVEVFLNLCSPFTEDFYYPILSRESCLSRFPETRRTYVRLREGHYTGGNLVLIRPAWFLENRSRLQTFVANRKKPLKLFTMFPPLFLLKFLCRRLTIRDVEQYLSRLLALRARAIPCDLVELGTDVDKPSDLAAVRKALSGSTESPAG